MSEQKIKIGKFVSRAKVHSNSYNEADGTVRLTFATEKKVLVRSWPDDYYQVLVCTKDAIESNRIDNGAVHLLDTHKHGSVKEGYGNVVRWGIENNECWADVKLTKRKDAEGVVTDIIDGIIRTVSIYAKPHAAVQMPLLEGESIPTVRITKWEPLEISLALVPEDEGSVIRSTNTTEDNNFIEINISENINRTAMPEENTTQQNSSEQNQSAQQNNAADTSNASEQSQNTQQNAGENIQRNAGGNTTQQNSAGTTVNITGEIMRSCLNAGVSMDFATTLVERNLSLDASRAAIIDEIARTNQNNMKNNNPNIRLGGDPATNENNIIRTAIQDAIIHRADPGSLELNEKSREFRNMSLLDIARSCLIRGGMSYQNAYTLGKEEVIKRAIATTDYADLLTSTVTRQLRKFYKAANSDWRKLGTRTTVSDFRQKTGIELDGSVTFEKIAEGGEYKSSRMLQTDKATIGVDTYGKMIAISRKAMINDDLDAFSRIPKIFAQGAANLQTNMFWDMITTPAKTPDGVNLFHTATHKNLAASGTIIDEASINAGIVAMGLQQSPAGEELGLIPEFLIVPLEKKLEAQKLVAAVMASKTGDVNVFKGAFEIIADARLSRKSSTAWYLACNPNMMEGLMYAYLDGEEELYTDTQTNFYTDSIETKARIEFGVAAWNYRGWYKNPGAAGTSGQ